MIAAATRRPDRGIGLRRADAFCDRVVVFERH
jgi:hypothetical protein